ncbi:tetratricopeptide repeat protein [Candidatus Magnetominusculus xianensis]|uniref:Tetratricopeptide TPR_2 repeat protein n=1 Tax=Candidatus Magnetominusculus xianensis TaxID=1748249 RepID=A0ABR5SCA2_9BACT|nr:tetratricopeptide repeat protein [Candidatus Magnetominusculus xianensis]KWT78995.1 tetratricopeptide TPR_2 repeat protein [Candidatus Magnetominusculus xianensis]MBF0404998.1 tetratricopeptide repeat protein [Nitrospirota bacterium]
MLVYLPVRNYDFIRYDDEQYVTENPQVLKGLTADGLLWAFKTTQLGFWQPLSWISHMADVEVFGLNAGGHHLVSVLFHVINTLLLFFALSALTGAVWRGAFVAALFALHPMHVESVAWIAERKDVLSGFFWILAVWAYVYYVLRPSAGRYMLVLCCVVLGLMSKPMLVTLPIVLLLFDYWPLGRFSGNVRALFIEKLPMFALSAVSGLVTFFTETAGRNLQTAPLDGRIINAVVSCGRYIAKVFYPVRLSVIYPLGDIALWQIIVSACMIAAVSAAALWNMKRYPYLFTGWFLFLIVMLPSSGIVTFGALEFQSMADRYTYVPYVGLFLIFAMALPDSWLNTPAKKNAAAAAAIIVVLVCITASTRQLRHWRDTITLFQYAVSVTQRNYVAYNNLGTALALKGLDNASFTAFEMAVAIEPTYKTAYVNLGNVLLQRNKPEEALRYYEKAVSIDTQLPGAYHGIGVALLSMGRRSEAAAYFEKAIAIDPNHQAARHFLKSLREQGNNP